MGKLARLVLGRVSAACSNLASGCAAEPRTSEPDQDQLQVAEARGRSSRGLGAAQSPDRRVMVGRGGGWVGARGEIPAGILLHVGGRARKPPLCTPKLAP